jgi:hypothetical protein
VDFSGSGHRERGGSVLQVRSVNRDAVVGCFPGHCDGVNGLADRAHVAYQRIEVPMRATGEVAGAEPAAHRGDLGWPGGQVAQQQPPAVNLIKLRTLITEQCAAMDSIQPGHDDRWR